MLRVFLENEDSLSKQDYTGKGNQNKWYKNEYWIKQDAFGYEGFAEKIVTLLLSHSNINLFCPYDLCEIYEAGTKRGQGCISPTL